MESYLDHMSCILDIHAPFKRVNKYKLRFKIKPWVTPPLQKFISVKNSLFKKFINYTYSQTKEHLHTRYYDHKNLSSNHLNRSKKNY